MYDRASRLAEWIRLEVAEIIQRRATDPRLRLTSITRVVLTSDLKHAKIFVSAFGPRPKEKEAEKGFQSATKFIRGELGKRLHTRTVPSLTFIYDDSLKKGDKVLGLMKKIEREREGNAQDA